MAKLERKLFGDIDMIHHDIEEAIMKSVSATKEDESCFELAGGRCIVSVYERYSYFGGNRVSLSLTLAKSGKFVMMSAITSGGSQAMFFKINTIGEESFLNTICDVVEKYGVDSDYSE